MVNIRYGIFVVQHRVKIYILAEVAGVFTPQCFHISHDFSEGGFTVFKSPVPVVFFVAVQADKQCEFFFNQEIHVFFQQQTVGGHVKNKPVTWGIQLLDVPDKNLNKREI